MIYSIIDSQAPSLSGEHANKGQIVLPSLGEWFENVLHLDLLLVSMVAAFWSLEVRSLAKMAAVIGLLMFASQVLHGAQIFSPDSTWSFDRFTWDFFTTSIGSILLASIIAVQIYVFNLISLSGKNSVKARVSASLFMIATSSLIHAVIYACMFFFIQPLASDVRGRVLIPFEGSYHVGSKPIASREGAKSSTDASDSVFSFIPQNIRGANLSLEGAKGPSIVEWSKTNSSSLYTMNIYFLADCFRFSQTEVLNFSYPEISREDVKSFRLEIDSGNLGIETSLIDYGSFEFRHPYPTFYWVRKGTEDEEATIEVQNFFGEESQLTGRFAGPLRIFVRAPLQQSDNSASNPSSRFLSFEIDDEESDFEVAPPSTFQAGRDHRTKCRSVSSLEELNAEGDDQANIVSMIVELIPDYADDGSYSSYDSDLSLSGLQGWAKVENIKEDTFARHSMGTTDFIHIMAPTSLSVDGIELKTDKDSTVLIVGGTYLSPSNEEGISFSSNSDRIWIDSKMINQSYWEKLSIEMKLALVGWLGTVLYLFRNPIFSFIGVLRRGKKLKGIPR